MEQRSKNHFYRRLVHAPVGFDEQQYQFTDLFNEGLSGILTEQANGWYYKHNLGDGNFEQAKLVSPKPSFAGLGQLQLADLDADGGKQLVILKRSRKVILNWMMTMSGMGFVLSMHYRTSISAIRTPGCWT